MERYSEGHTLYAGMENYTVGEVKWRGTLYGVQCTPYTYSLYDNYPYN